MPKLAGRCLCGQVTYRIGTEEPLDGLTVCHCRQCNRWAGGPAHYAVCRTSEIVVEGEVTWFQSSADVKRGFCARCGSSLFWQSEPGNRLYVTAGSIDPPTGLAVGEHIWTGAKADWDEIAGHAPQRSAE